MGRGETWGRSFGCVGFDPQSANMDRITGS